MESELISKVAILLVRRLLVPILRSMKEQIGGWKSRMRMLQRGKEAQGQCVKKSRTSETEEEP